MILQVIAIVLAIAIVLMWTTGGYYFHTPALKFEASSLDPWVLGFLVLSWVQYRFSQPSYPLQAWHSFWESLTSNERVAKRATLGIFIFFFGLMFLGHVFKHGALVTNAFDVTFVHQSLYYLFGPERLQHCDLCQSGTYFGEHLTYTFFLLAPFTQFLKSDEFIFLIQILALAVPLFVLMRLGPLEKYSRIWPLFILIVLCERALRNSGFSDFREDHLAFAFLIASLVSIYRAKVFAYFVFLIAAIVTKENIGLITAFIAYPILFERRLPLHERERKWIAGMTFLVSIIWTIVAFKFLIPHFNAGDESGNNIVIRFPELGKTPNEILVNILTSPTVWWNLIQEKLLTFEALKYILLLFLPYILFLVRAKSWLIPCLPGLAMNLVSGAPTQRMLQFHYDLVILPFMIFGLAIGFSKMLEDGKPSFRWLGRPAHAALLIALCFSGRWPGLEIQRYWPNSEHRSQAQFLRSLAFDERVAARNELLAQMSHLPKLSPLPIPTSPPGPDGRENWRVFWSEAVKKNRTNIDGRQAFYARHFVLDLYEPWQKWLHDEIAARKTSSWRIGEKDSTGRIVVVTRSSGLQAGVLGDGSGSEEQGSCNLASGDTTHTTESGCCDYHEANSWTAPGGKSTSCQQ